ncbi:hypothetical protein, conserved [Eimeria tenella]|uniref:Uncharacterized protein n=1 Tax=Eimeria tenella TaxID=5802 RepID=U6KZ48_EIMTE|nr:hypothetical protein, conserved [Eimeria tenella]CDJ42213.1 hypothetical protein, conserved [Eimeria tenella]|eukprot:XP_013232963.1 hypothetical protein, conserved [Eimeria tenella]
MLPSSPGFTGPRLNSRPPGSTIPATAASTSYNPNDNNSEQASAPHSCFGAQSDLRLTVGGFNEGGLVTLITADKQFFCLPASLIPVPLEIGSVVTISLRRDIEEEAARRRGVLKLQADVLECIQQLDREEPRRLADPLLLLPCKEEQQLEQEQQYRRQQHQQQTLP